METEQTKIAVLVEKVGTMSTVLNKLDSKIDLMTEKFAAKEEVADLRGEVVDLRHKVTSLENWRVWTIGMAAGLAVAANFLKDWLLHK